MNVDKNRLVRNRLGDRYVGATEAAAIARCGRTTLHRASVAGDLAWASLAGRRRVYRLADVEAWAEARRRRREEARLARAAVEARRRFRLASRDAAAAVRAVERELRGSTSPEEVRTAAGRLDAARARLRVLIEAEAAKT